MWRMEEGMRTLVGAEWALFRVGLSTLWDRVDDRDAESDDQQTGVEVSDELQPTQRAAMLTMVRTTLSREDVPRPS